MTTVIWVETDDQQYGGEVTLSYDENRYDGAIDCVDCDHAYIRGNDGKDAPYPVSELLVQKSIKFLETNHHDITTEILKRQRND